MAKVQPIVISTPTQEQVDQKLELHSKWLNRGGLSKRAFFINEDLTNINFKNTNLRCAVMRNCNLTGQDFEGADIRYLDVKECITIDVDTSLASDSRNSTI
jgi:uncharacterized protein YjbI with pentapeptide repeats